MVPFSVSLLAMVLRYQPLPSLAREKSFDTRVMMKLYFFQLQHSITMR